MSASVSGEQILGIGFFAWAILGVIFAYISNRQERNADEKPLPVITD
jgi:hypothetical protein